MRNVSEPNIPSNRSLKHVLNVVISWKRMKVNQVEIIVRNEGFFCIIFSDDFLSDSEKNIGRPTRNDLYRNRYTVRFTTSRTSK